MGDSKTLCIPEAKGLKDKYCQTLHVATTFTGQNKSTVFDYSVHVVEALSCIVDGVQNDSQIQSK